MECGCGARRTPGLSPLLALGSASRFASRPLSRDFGIRLPSDTLGGWIEVSGSEDFCGGMFPLIVWFNGLKDYLLAEWNWARIIVTVTFLFATVWWVSMFMPTFMENINWLMEVIPKLSLDTLAIIDLVLVYILLQIMIIPMNYLGSVVKVVFEFGRKKPEPSLMSCPLIAHKAEITANMLPTKYYGGHSPKVKRK